METSERPSHSKATRRTPRAALERLHGTNQPAGDDPREEQRSRRRAPATRPGRDSAADLDRATDEPSAMHDGARLGPALPVISSLISSPTDRQAADQAARPFWNPRSGVFNGALLRQAIVMRGWTVAEFAVVSSVSPACLYRALGGYGVIDRIAIRIFEGLRQRQPLAPIPEFPKAR